MAIQSIRRASAQPPPAALITEDQQMLALLSWLRLVSQQLNLLHSAIQQFTVTVGAAAGFTTVTLPIPYFDALYVAHATPSWNTTVYIAAPGDVTKTTVKFTYGTAAPGGGGTLYVITVR